MLSDLHSIVYKGGQYALDIALDPDSRLYWETPNRVRFTGNNGVHLLSRRSDSWRCSCSTYQRYVSANLEPTCEHVKALEISRAEFQEEIPGERLAYALAYGQ